MTPKTLVINPKFCQLLNIGRQKSWRVFQALSTIYSNIASTSDPH